MSEVQTVLEQVRSHFLAFEHPKAEAALKAALRSTPDHPDLNAELGMLYCYLQKEFEAAELLPKTVGAERHAGLVQMLADYFHCRSLIAQKHGVKDEKGAAFHQKVKKYAAGSESNVGIRLSACLIVKNEEAHLDRCLTSLKGLVDEIVVVDTGSTDNTVAIAENHGAIIGHFAWCDDFAAARNESLKLATGDWALWIDADEEVAPESFNSIREGLIRPQFGGYFIKIVNFMKEAGGADQFVHTPVRLFRRIPGVEFTGRIHEQVLVSIKELGLIPATLQNAVIYHYGYNAEAMQSKDKLNRTVNMLLKEVQEHPSDPFQWFNLANAYSVAGRAADAEAAARKCISLLPSDAPYGSVAYQILTSSLISLGRKEEALAVSNKVKKGSFHTIVNQFERSHALYELGRFSEALLSIDECLAMDWPQDLTGDYGIKTHKGYVLKGQILLSLDRLEEAAEAIDRAYAVDPTFSIGIFAKARLLEKREQFEEACGLYIQCSSQPGLQACAKFAARAAGAAGDFQKAAVLCRNFWQQNNSDMEAWYGWLAAAETVDDSAGILAAYNALAAIRDLDSSLLVNWGRRLEEAGELEEALMKYLRAAEIDGAYANALFNAGDVLYKLTRYTDAATVYEAALKLDPTNAQGWFVLGNCFARLGVEQGATISYQQALAIEPSHAGASHNLNAICQAA